MARSPSQELGKQKATVFAFAEHIVPVGLSPRQALAMQGYVLDTWRKNPQLCGDQIKCLMRTDARRRMTWPPVVLSIAIAIGAALGLRPYRRDCRHASRHDRRNRLYTPPYSLSNSRAGRAFNAYVERFNAATPTPSRPARSRR